MAETALLIIGIILVVGAIAKIIGDRYKLPSIIFLLIFGIILGPSGIELITSETFDGGLSSIVGFAVAIIVFEGAFHLNFNRIKRSSRSTLLIVTLGALIGFIGTAIPIYSILGASIEISLLIASLLIATGPTVITPIMNVIEVRPPVETTMETEGIINDVTAAILAIVIFEAIVVPSDPTVETFIFEFGQRVAIGIVVGLVGAYALYKVAQIIKDQRNSIEDLEILVIVSAVLIYAASNQLASESGVAAVAVAGIVLGNISFPYKREIKSFADEITPVVLSVVFIILAALVELNTILDILWYEGLLVVLIIILIVRPILVFASTYNGLFTRNEKLFMSFVGPRGIIPASVASLFAIQLRDMGMIAEAEILTSTVFLVIFFTVFVEGGPARYIAQKLQIKPMTIIIVGGGETGKELADRLSETRDESITIIEWDESKISTLRNEGYNVVQGDGKDTSTLEEAGIKDASIVATMTEFDDANLLTVQLAKDKYDVEETIARVNNDDNKPAFEEIGVQTVSRSEATAIEADNKIERPIVTKWMDNLKKEGDIIDVQLTNDKYDKKTISDLNQDLPKSCLVVLVERNGEVIIPTGETKIMLNDNLTIVTQHGKIHDVKFVLQGQK